MWIEFAIKSLIGLAPVIVFLAVLVQLDSYKLVRFRLVATVLAAGALLAMLAYAVNGYAINVLKLDLRSYSLYVAPFVEETLKAIAVIALFRTNRIAFAIDAVILGFAAGTGFALFENLYYLHVLSSADWGVWVTRGLGTAIMHGGTAAIMAALSQTLVSKRESAALYLFLPGLLVAVVLHGIFNRYPDHPLVSVIPVLLVMPVAFFVLFRKSEHAIHKWLVADIKSHEDLLRKLGSGELPATDSGRDLVALAAKLEADIIAHVFDYLRVHTELVLHAEAMLLSREQGIEIAVDVEVHDGFMRLHTLERVIGHTTLLAIRPHLHFTRLELWELYHLEEQARHPPPRDHHWFEHVSVAKMHI